MWEMGYFSEYPYSFGETPDSVLNEVFLQHFGREFRELAHSDDSNLMYTLYKANPELVRAHLQKTFRELPMRIADSLRINIPIDRVFESIPWPAVSGIFAWQTFLLCTIPLLATRLCRRRDYSAISEPRSRALYEHLLPFIPLCGFLPWILTYPQPHYIFPIIVPYLATMMGKI